MKNYSELFKQEENALKIKAELVLNEKLAESKVIKDFCEDNLFEFLDYLQNTFYVKEHGVNYHFDRAVYRHEIIREHVSINDIERLVYFKTQIYHNSTSINFGIVKVTCVDFKSVLTYEGKVMTIEEFEKTVVGQIQKTIQANKVFFQILRK